MSTNIILGMLIFALVAIVWAFALSKKPATKEEILTTAFVEEAEEEK